MRSASPHRLAAQVLLLAAATAPVMADEVRLRDGRVLVGTVQRMGAKLHVETLDGRVVVPADDVAAVRTEAELRAELERLAQSAGNTAFGHVELARTARDYGLLPEMWGHLEAALPAATTGTPAERRLRQLLSELEPVVLPAKWRNARTEVRVRELLLRLRPGASPALAATVTELLAREPNADAALRDRARESSRTPHRAAALRALARRDQDPSNRGCVLRSTVFDRDANLRRAMALHLRVTGNADAAAHDLAPGLMLDHPVLRMRTADALAELRTAAAVDLLVDAGPLAGKTAAALAGVEDGASRAHVAFLRQTSFVRDFDVEVAQAAFIADPKIDVVQSGVVLDTTVHAITKYRTDTVRAYRHALRRLTGADPGANPAHWAAWRAELPKTARR
ncbi:MAG: hypothetical protein AAF628_17125 [Planctomycetota bacterium]